MTTFPRPQTGSLLLQIIVMLLCAAALYFAIHSFTSWQKYSRATSRYEDAGRKASRHINRLHEYHRFVNRSPWYSRQMKPPRWEKIEETWVNLPLYDLTSRLGSLYRLDRPFALATFSAESGGKTDETGKDAGGNDNNRALTFRLEGYFLCPTQ